MVWVVVFEGMGMGNLSALASNQPLSLVINRLLVCGGHPLNSRYTSAVPSWLSRRDLSKSPKFQKIQYLLAILLQYLNIFSFIFFNVNEDLQHSGLPDSNRKNSSIFLSKAAFSWIIIQEFEIFYISKMLLWGGGGTSWIHLLSEVFLKRFL